MGGFCIGDMSGCGFHFSHSLYTEQQPLRHHASTVDLLIQGEFGWDPEEFHYALQQWAGPWSSNWYKYLLTVPFIPVIHFFGLNDTGSLFALEWWMHFPDEGAGGKCNKELLSLELL